MKNNEKQARKQGVTQTTQAYQLGIKKPRRKEQLRGKGEIGGT